MGKQTKTRKQRMLLQNQEKEQFLLNIHQQKYGTNLATIANQGNQLMSLLNPVNSGQNQLAFGNQSSQDKLLQNQVEQIKSANNSVNIGNQADQELMTNMLNRQINSLVNQVEQLKYGTNLATIANQGSQQMSVLNPLKYGQNQLAFGNHSSQVKLLQNQVEQMKSAPNSINIGNQVTNQTAQELMTNMLQRQIKSLGNQVEQLKYGPNLAITANQGSQLMSLPNQDMPLKYGQNQVTLGNKSSQVKLLQNQVEQIKSTPDTVNTGNQGSNQAVQAVMNMLSNQVKLLKNQVQEKKYQPNLVKLAKSQPRKQAENSSNPYVWVDNSSKEFGDTAFLSNIFGCFGNVIRINLSKKSNGVLIHLQNPQHAALCCTWLNGVKIGSSRMSVKPPKITGGLPGQGYKKKFANGICINSNEETSKDFFVVNKITHRFGVSKSAEYGQNYRALGPVLIIKFEPKDKLSELKNYLLESGITVKEIMLLKQGVAIVEVSSKEEALCALGKLHLTQPTWASQKLSFKLAKDEKISAVRFSEKNKISKNIPSLETKIKIEN